MKNTQDGNKSSLVTSPVCDFAKELYLEWQSDQTQIEQLLQMAIVNCQKKADFVQDEELYRGDIAELINGREEY